MTNYNVDVTPGSGNIVAADAVNDGTLGSSVNVQYIKIMDGTLGGTGKAIVSNSALSVALSTQATNTVTLSSNVTLASGTVTLSSGPTVTLSSGPTVAVSSGTISLSSATTNLVTLSSGPTVTLSSNPTVLQGTNPWLVGGDVAAGVTDSGNPVKVGGQAQVVLTAVTSGQRVNGLFDKVGKFVTAGAIRTLKGVQRTTISSTTETTIVTLGSAGTFNDIYSLVVTNESSLSTFVDFRDATAGTIRMTIAAPTNDTRGFAVAVDSAMIQATSSNNWTATSGSSVASLVITALYVQNI